MLCVNGGFDKANSSFGVLRKWKLWCAPVKAPIRLREWNRVAQSQIRCTLLEPLLPGRQLCVNGRMWRLLVLVASSRLMTDHDGADTFVLPDACAAVWKRLVNQIPADSFAVVH